MSDIFAVDLPDFEQQVLAASHEGPILVDFWADWCSPCHAINPHLKKLIANNEGDIRLAKVEVDEGDNMKLAGRYKVRGFPTIMLIVDGEERGRFAGARATHWMQEWIDEHLQPQV
ncbi:MAG: thioredoxin family protein [bacterium]